MTDNTRWLLTRSEWEKIINELPGGDTCGQCRNAITKAQLRKVANLLQSDDILQMIASLFKSARAEGPITKWADGTVDAQEVIDLIKQAITPPARS